MKRWIVTTGTQRMVFESTCEGAPSCSEIYLVEMSGSLGLGSDIFRPIDLAMTWDEVRSHLGRLLPTARVEEIEFELDVENKTVWKVYEYGDRVDLNAFSWKNELGGIIDGGSDLVVFLFEVQRCGVIGPIIGKALRQKVVQAVEAGLIDE